MSARATGESANKFERAAVRWFSRYLDEGKDVSLLKAHLALAALSELRLGGGPDAEKMLTELIDAAAPLELSWQR